MKTLRYFLCVAFIALVLSSCATSARMVVVERPSPPVVVRVTPPYHGWVFVNEGWVWRSGGYVYQRGRWVAPRPGYLWRPGHWQRVRRGWRWSRGYWRHL